MRNNERGAVALIIILSIIGALLLGGMMQSHKENSRIDRRP